MFEQPSSSSPTGVSAEPPLQTRTGTASRDGNTYTIPEKYLPPAHHLPTRSSKRIFIIGGIVLVVVFAVIAVVVYALQFVVEPPSDGVTPLPSTNANGAANSNRNVSNTNTNENLNNSNTTTGTTNGDANVNTNTNANTNENANTPSNANTNTSNTNTTNVSNTSPTPEPSSPLQVVANAADKDRDDLTDTEEELYGTKVSLPDSDKDGFVDGTEVKNLYSPLEPQETLQQSSLVTAYKNDAFSWSVLYPTRWLADTVDPEGREVLFTPDTGEGEWMEVLITENPQQQTAAEWYASLYPDNSTNTFTEVEIAGLKGIVTKNGLTYYLGNGTTIIGLVYNVGSEQQAHFQTTFAMMVKSFTFISTTAQ